MALPIVALILTLLAQNVTALWPKPTSLTPGDVEVIRLHPTFRINPPKDCWIPADLLQAIDTTTKHIKDDRLAPLRLDVLSLEAQAAATKQYVKQLNLQATCSQVKQTIVNHVNKPLEQWDESYTLQIRPDLLDATISANSSLGLLRGLQTFSQLVYTSSTKQNGKPVRYLLNAPPHILDRPALAWRGLLLDTARNFYPVKTIKQVLDAMSWSKMNVFYWHITDSQSWPLQIDRYPELSAKGAYSASETYCQQDLLRTIAYANSIGIQVVVEIDSPGHTDSIALSHPELVACSGADWLANAAEPPAGQLRVANDHALQLMDGILHEVASTVPGSYLATGGDEVNLHCYENDAEAQAALRTKNQTLPDALNHWYQSTGETVSSTGKTPVVWGDAFTGVNASKLDKQSIVLAWRGEESLSDIVKLGNRFVHVPYTSAYLDCGLGGWVGTPPSWCSYNSWWTMHAFDPYANVTESARSQVLGGMAALWSEQSSPENVHQNLWPRAAALAEVYWTGRSMSAPNSTEALSRLHDFRYRIVARGIPATPLQPHWCALRPGACIL